MVMMKRKGRGELGVSNGEWKEGKEKRSWLLFHSPSLAVCHTCYFSILFSWTCISVSGLIPVPGCVPFWPKHRVSTMVLITLGCLWL